MGIKFHCPNGHKMNVKSFLAGKKGVCPKCGIGVEVPLESEGAANQRVQASPAVAVASAQAPVADEAEAPSFHAGDEESIESVMAKALNGTGGRSGGRSAPLPAVIAEDPLKVWYTCTKSGDRYGPVNGEAMGKWLSEGRVSSESLVWREGWAEWRRAVAVFPSLSPVAAMSGLPAGLSPIPTATAAPEAAAKPKMDDLLSDALMGATSSAMSTLSTSRRRSGKDKMVLMSMGLIGAAILLFGGLVLVLLNQ